jgi:protoporphyrinogen oxidase
MTQKQAIIIGAGPAGLTAAYELLSRTDIKPIILEKSEYVGGISRTVNYKGNRIDIGGHRFFSKSDRVMDWWLRMIPLQHAPEMEDPSGQGKKEQSAPASIGGATADGEDPVMLIRRRKSRIYYLGKFFDYPVSLTLDTVLKLGFLRAFSIVLSYLKSVVRPIRNEKNLEEFFINRFGEKLYLTFFKSYTEKLWGVPCDEISAEWGAQRIKGLSIAKTFRHFFKRIFKGDGSIDQRDTETSLIEQFLYPKLGPGQMWEHVARRITAMGGEILKGCELDRVHLDGNRIKAVEALNLKTKERTTFGGEYYFSSMSIQEFIRAIGEEVPGEIREISEGLVYRDFITVGLLLKKLWMREKRLGDAPVKDNWIYIQEPDVSVGRIQIFNNWSPYLVADLTKFWVGLEYFCSETDGMWSKPDEEMIRFAEKELKKMGMIEDGDLLDGVVLRTPKAYPAYFGTYDRFADLREYLDRFENFFPIGRNGMHKYNNQDHSMSTAMIAVDNILQNSKDKSNIWAVNVDDEYIESG